ncbi:Rab1a [Hexamita inflata]|uniref:Rab1a n=1 Tax=Hexamita inflata TaxID=28002 RepID=A0ABP1GZS0_9EUKA
MSEEFKVALVGDTGVGKTCLAVRFVSNIFNIAQASTSGASFMRKTLTIDDKTIKFQIWDTAGQEKFRSLAPMYYRSAAAVVVVFDVTRRASFEDVQYWIKEVKTNGDKDAIIVVVGNKIDKSGRNVTAEEANSYAKSIQAFYIEASAQTGEGVTSIFTHLAQQNLKGKTTSQQFIDDEPKDNKSKSCC